MDSGACQATYSPWGCNELNMIEQLTLSLFSCIYYIFFIHSSVEGHLDCFHILTIVNKAAMNTGMHISFRTSVFVFFRRTTRSGIAGSSSMVGKSVSFCRSQSAWACVIHVSGNRWVFRSLLFWHWFYDCLTMVPIRLILPAHFSKWRHIMFLPWLMVPSSKLELKVQLQF